MIDISALREQFPILQQHTHGDHPPVYLDNAATTHKPCAVLERIHAFYTSQNSNIHRGIHALSEEASDAYERARACVKHFLNAAHESEIIFTHGTTDALNMLADAFSQRHIAEGDEMCVTAMEHHSNFIPWQQLCRRCGARIVVVSPEEDGTIHPHTLRSHLTERTRLVALTHVSNVTGAINPLRELIGTAHGADIPVVVDGAQAVAHCPVDVRELECDFFVFSGHKMYAETGAGVLYGRKQVLESLPPSRFGGGMIESVSSAHSSWAGLPHRFEAGTPNLSGVLSLDAAIRFLDSLGRPNIVDYEKKVYAYACEALSRIPNLTIYAPSAPRCGALSFTIDGAHPYDVATLLDKLGVAVRSGSHCAEPLMRHYGIDGTIRASFALYTTYEDIDMLCRGLKKVIPMLV